MADISNLTKYLEEYSSSILHRVGKEFSYTDFIAHSKDDALRPTGLATNFYEEKIDFPWLEELEMVTEKIMAIASKPRTHIKVEKDVKKAEQAVKIDNNDIIETLKVPAYWKQKGERFLPEKVFTDIFEIEYAIYENRFIINLVDKMMLFLSQIVAQLYEQIKNVNKKFIDSHISLADVDIIQDLAGFDTFKYIPNSSSRKLRDKSDDAKLLTTKDSPYVEALRKILICRGNVSHVRSTPFYKEVKKAKPLSDSDVHLTNMLAGDRTYAPCYDFYRKLLHLMVRNINDTAPVNPKDYHNYVLANMFSALNDLGFKDLDIKKKIKLNDNVMHLERYALKKDDLSLFITTHDEDHIDLSFELEETEGLSVPEGEVGDKRMKSVVSIDLYPSTTAEYPNADELTEYFRKKIQARIKSGYTNAFIVTAVDGTQKDDVIICSPQIYKIDANIKSMIDSCIIFAEGDNYIYSHICPVCGFYVDGEQDDGNCYCANCDSAYSLMSHGRNEKVKESVWIKRLKNPEIV
ncbi:MAG: DUF2357 domain-containing protein [Erysipelotrichaceae bacterium]|nr:DUF2357 domain-containing protein [Erysipelotrichaceae bacterium]